MLRYQVSFFLTAAVMLPLSCSHTAVPQAAAVLSPEFEAYWFSGLAELSVFDLQQSRYGALRKGTAAMVFVTEPFSVRRQVKLDQPESAGDDRRDVLKLNMTRNFDTGIYPYSTELSVFSPVDLSKGPHALKAVFSCQEWCGQVYTQFNRKGKHYAVQSYSYFESEGDREEKLPVTWLEDELWSVGRINPDALPLGEVSIIPSETYTRFLHRDRKPEKAMAAWLESDGGRHYTLTYASGRVLSIQFAADFPHAVLGWTETYRDGSGAGAAERVTSGTLRKRIRIDYWNHNAVADSIWRQELGY